MTTALASFIQGKWQAGNGKGRPLENPATEEVLASASTSGFEFSAVLDYAREVGGQSLQKMNLKQRGELLSKLAAVMADNREELLKLAQLNGGNTRGDAKFDVDGASGTLAAYSKYVESEELTIRDGEAVLVGRTSRLIGQHVWLPRKGAAILINAFNFPAWGFAEKAACALLAGMPVVCKPATATALVAHRMFELFVEAGIPEGSLSLICGSVGDLLNHVTSQDVVSFTGSSDTAKTIRTTDSVINAGTTVNVEADSLNAAVLGPDVDLFSETGQLFLKDVVKDMTQKTGQKCTAIRRVLVPASAVEGVCEELASRLSEVKIGDPTAKGISMGPVATKKQKLDVLAGIARLSADTEAVWGGDGSEVTPEGTNGKGYFVSPVLRLAKDPSNLGIVNEHEVFGPVATLIVYDGTASQAAKIVAAPGGGLVSSVYSDDKPYLREAVLGMAPYHGRIYIGSEKMAAQSPGPGTALPSLLHGGPGRAGGGEELGGIRGIRLYQQRVALQGDKSLLKSIID